MTARTEGSANGPEVGSADGALLEAQASLATAREELRAATEREWRFRAMVDAAQDALYLISRQMRIIYVNRAGTDLLKADPDEVVGKHLRELFAPEGVERQISNLTQVFETGKRVSVENRYVFPKGEIWLNARLFPVRDQEGKTIAVLGTSMDITERKHQENASKRAHDELERRVEERTRQLREANQYLTREMERRRQEQEERLALERQVQQAQKLESLGVLAGGIAHDFNNLLMGVLGNAELALLQVPPQSETARFLEGIQTAAIRLGELTTQMLAYSGKGKFVVEPTNLSFAVIELGQLLEASISKKVSITYELEENLPVVMADTSQIRQVIMNLITNAAESYGETSGEVKLRTGVTVVGDDDQVGFEPGLRLSPGPHVFLEVADEGSGMAESTRNRIFEPFYTTKITGRGLGMAVVLGIIRGHHGAIKVESEIGEGSRFTVLLPQSAGTYQRPPVSEAERPRWRRRGLVLFVDDEEIVRAAAQPMLERFGFSVVTAVDGSDALDQLAAHGDRVDLMILDLMMPRMDGKETFERVRELYPQLPTILASGYDEQEAGSRFAGRGLAGFIQKPFTMKVLETTLRRVFDPEA